MLTVPILFGLGCAASVWLAAPEAKRFAWALLGVWAAANAAWFYDMLSLMPLLDLAVGVVAVKAWSIRRTIWLSVLIQLISARLILHILNYVTSGVFLVPYIHGLNLLFMLELFIVSSGGLCGDCFHLLRGLRRISVFPRSAPAPEVKR
jgi:hypothetical protein